MSMGAGLYVPPMMLTPQMQVAHMRLFAPMGTGYGLGMNPIAHVPLGAYFPGPSLQPVAGLRTSQPMAGLNFSSLGHPSQGPPLAPCVNTSPVDINLNASTAASHFKTPSNENDLVQNNDSQLIGNADAGGSEKPKVIQCQPTVKSFEESNLSVKHDLPSDACSSDEVIFDKLKNIVSSTIK